MMKNLGQNIKYIEMIIKLNWKGPNSNMLMIKLIMPMTKNKYGKQLKNW